MEWKSYIKFLKVLLKEKIITKEEYNIYSKPISKIHKIV